ncbi:hypothetical protein ABG768_008659 [Culter alburnus]|uniref:nucleoside-diphosphate kinase n=1 Tax=Culter alburnus TaxID=194366 RepID=A0AAW1ZHF0_CULAL
MDAKTERTFIAIKPNGASEELLKQHYINLKDWLIYPGLFKYMNSRASSCDGMGGLQKPGNIRGVFCIEVGRNIIHGRDSVASTNKEISLWFKPEEPVAYKSCVQDWIYE